MKAIQHTTTEGLVWVKKDRPDYELGTTLYLSPQDDINNYERVEPLPEEEEEEEI